MTTIRNMSVHAALGELKKIDQRIGTKIRKASFLGAKKLSADTVDMTTLSESKFEEKVKEEMQSIQDLMDNGAAIKQAIVLSNAVTKLPIGSKEMTVAEAIETKRTIGYKKELLSRLKSAKNTVMSKVEMYNESVEDNLDRQLAALGANKDKSNSSKDLVPFMEHYRNQNSWKVVDPLGIDELIEQLEDEIVEFETNVDVALSESNALTIISVEFK